MNRYNASGSGRGLPGLENPVAVNELDGLVGFGMKKEALALARRKLKAQHIRAADFNDVLNAILTLADRVKPWVPLVEAAYVRLSRRGQRSARFMMLCFHHNNRNYEAASRLVPQRFTRNHNLLELSIALESAIALDRMKEAGRLARKIPTAVEDAQETSMQAMLLHCLAQFCCRKGAWEKALRIWEIVQQDEILLRSAVLGMAEIHLARAVLVLRSGLEQNRQFGNHFDPDLATVVPGDERIRRDQTEKELNRLERALCKMLGKAGQEDLGIATREPKRVPGP